MTPSPEIIDFIQGWEDCRLTPYRDAAGLWTVGFGHLMEEGDDTETPITQEEADALFETELDHTAEEISHFIPGWLEQNEADALLAFAYNCGVRALKNSTMLRMIREQDMDQAADEFGKWTKAGGRVIQGLVRRRAAERRVFLHADYTGRP